MGNAWDKIAINNNCPNRRSMHESRSWIWSIIILIMMARWGVECAPVYQLMVSTSTSMASAHSNYTFEFLQQDDVDVTSSTIIQIVFPTDYQGILSDGAYTCYISSWIDTLAIPNVSCALAGLTMTISNAFATITGTMTVSLTFYGIAINQIINPMYAGTTSAISGTFSDSTTNSVIFSFLTNFGLSGIPITEGAMLCSITASPTTASSSSASMIVTVTAPIMIPFNTTLTISMQKYWPTNAVNSTTIMNNSIICQSL